MSEKKPKYITTTLPYVNASPHIGHALEFVQADTLARFWRAEGHEVFFNLGVDEHGQKVAQKADETGVGRQEFVDKYAEEFDELKKGLDLSNDSFIRTTSEAHKKAAQHIWNICNEKGDIYKKKYKGLYCVGCESFKVETDLVDGKCPDHGVAPQEIEEENYFFKLSEYQDYLIDYLSKEGSIVPEYRRQEALKFVKGGLSDLSISREVSRMDWGVPVPGDDNQVMYVWFDALTNYISCLGWPEDKAGNFKKFWQENSTLQLAGKDQIRFQSIIWQAMLKSAGIKSTDSIFYHGFINSDGQKMSKTLGNVIGPYELIDKYGTDASRYLLLRHVHPTDDSDITFEKLDEWYTANLVNGLGNLTARILKMSETHLEEPIETKEVTSMDIEALEHYQFQTVLDGIWAGIGAMDEYIAENEPFKVIKTELEVAKEMITKLVKDLHEIALSLKVFMPNTAEIILKAIAENTKPDNLFTRLEK
jgi:methionyl-tRNA synthetase